MGNATVAKRRAKRLLRELAAIQQEGGWTYMAAPRVHSFNTAPVVLLMAKLRRHGVKAPKGMAGKAAVFLESCRVKSEPLNLLYSKTMPFSVQASSCRTALCELALLEHATKKDTGRIRRAIDFMFEYGEGVRETTKVFEDYFAPGSLQDSYHYYFGHYYASLCLTHLPEPEARRYAAKQAALILLEDARHTGK